MYLYYRTSPSDLLMQQWFTYSANQIYDNFRGINYYPTSVRDSLITLAVRPYTSVRLLKSCLITDSEFIWGDPVRYTMTWHMTCVSRQFKRSLVSALWKGVCESINDSVSRTFCNVLIFGPFFSQVWKRKCSGSFEVYEVCNIHDIRLSAFHRDWGASPPRLNCNRELLNLWGNLSSWTAARSLNNLMSG